MNQYTENTVHYNQRPTLEDYDVGWICDTQLMFVAVNAMFDQVFSPPSVPANDPNTYIFGRIGPHKVVVACLPPSTYGLAVASRVATNMTYTFGKLRIRFLLGTAGGAPNKKHDIRLGDVVISTPKHMSGGVLRYERGKLKQDQEFKLKGALNSAPLEILSAVNRMRHMNEQLEHQLRQTVRAMLDKNPQLRGHYENPGAGRDVLFQSDFVHQDPSKPCESTCVRVRNAIKQRKEREGTNGDPVIHYGIIGAGQDRMRDASERDYWANRERLLCFETEAAATRAWNCLVIKGIADYADTHSNTIWTGYAAANAAAYAKELLCTIPLKSHADHQSMNHNYVPLNTTVDRLWFLPDGTDRSFVSDPRDRQRNLAR